MTGNATDDYFRFLFGALSENLLAWYLTSPFNKSLIIVQNRLHSF